MRYLILLLLLMSCAMTCSLASADSELGPTEYTKSSKDKKYVFVMLAPAKWRQFGKLHYKYPKSGLYLNNGSRTPLWTVDWYEFDVEISSDGQYLVRWGTWPRFGDKYETLALAFYNNGKLIRQYRVKDLVANPKYLPFSISHYQWLRDKSFNDKNKRLTVVTYKGWGSPGSEYKAGKKYIFDIKSGKVTNGSLPYHRRLRTQANKRLCWQGVSFG